MKVCQKKNGITTNKYKSSQLYNFFQSDTYIFYTLQFIRSFSKFYKNIIYKSI